MDSGQSETEGRTVVTMMNYIDVSPVSVKDIHIDLEARYGK